MKSNFSPNRNFSSLSDTENISWNRTQWSNVNSALIQAYYDSQKRRFFGNFGTLASGNSSTEFSWNHFTNGNFFQVRWTILDRRSTFFRENAGSSAQIFTISWQIFREIDPRRSNHFDGSLAFGLSPKLYFSNWLFWRGSLAFGLSPKLFLNTPNSRDTFYVKTLAHRPKSSQFYMNSILVESAASRGKIFQVLAFIPATLFKYLVKTLTQILAGS